MAVDHPSNEMERQERESTRVVVLLSMEHHSIVNPTLKAALYFDQKGQALKRRNEVRFIQEFIIFACLFDIKERR